AEALTVTDRRRLSDSELLEHLEAATSLLGDGLLTHVQMATALMVETYRLVEACQELLGWDDNRVLEMLAGLSYQSTEPARRLGELARLAASKPELRRLLSHFDDRTAERICGFAPEFAGRFEEYRWSPMGIRALSRDAADPTLADQPALLLRLIANQMEGGFDPDAVDTEKASRREELAAEARRQLAGHSPLDRQRFEEALERAERAYPLREDNVFYAVQTPLGLIRYAALEAGARLSQRGQIDQPDDVFFLEQDELREALQDGEDRRELIRRRKGERAWVLAHPGPESYGRPPGDPPSLRYLPPEVRHTTDGFFWMTKGVLDKGTSQGSAEGGIQGVAASPGRYTGTVRVILDESQFGKLRPGDVVVCPVTQPTWSVLFPSMGAVVTDSGGILSHPAIIAREYGVPAVVATGNATQIIADGQQVAVDGEAGIVRLLD
ncbi:MAG TPA: PEP-utilizing enzyme, partial [Longimicrobiales bacterium]|nr:PEP-utilizing enzyme [Longimicrobiales bacterium]